jgi:hypothetical protein
LKKKRKENAFLRRFFVFYDLQRCLEWVACRSSSSFLLGLPMVMSSLFLVNFILFVLCGSNCHLHDACISDDAFHFVHIL